MTEYHKIPTVWERSPDTKFKTLIPGKWATPELECLKDARWMGTEKVDGTNIRIMWDGNKIAIGGRTDNAQIPAPLYAHLSELLTVEQLQTYPAGMVLYGEGYGHKIGAAGDSYDPENVHFILFDVAVNGLWLEQTNMLDIAEALHLDYTPCEYSGTLEYLIYVVRQGFVSELAEVTAEGLVMRPSCELLDRQGRRIICKVKHKDFER